MRREKLLIFLFLVTLSMCVQDRGSVSFTAEEDARVMAELLYVWTAQTIEGEVTLTICEDLERAARGHGCVVEHIVRGEGRSETETIDRPSGIGCGGCPFGVQGFLQGTIVGGIFTEERAVKGEIILGNIYDDDLYELPYGVRLSGSDFPSFVFNGKLENENRLVLKIISGTLDTGETEEFVFTPVEQATCPTE